MIIFLFARAEEVSIVFYETYVNAFVSFYKILTSFYYLPEVLTRFYKIKHLTQ